MSKRITLTNTECQMVGKMLRVAMNDTFYRTKLNSWSIKDAAAYQRLKEISDKVMYGLEITEDFLLPKSANLKEEKEN